jgi:hypothetical protein
MHYKCTTPRHIGMRPTHVGPLQYALELYTCSALVVILVFLLVKFTYMGPTNMSLVVQ